MTSEDFIRMNLRSEDEILLYHYLTTAYFGDSFQSKIYDKYKNEEFKTSNKNFSVDVELSIDNLFNTNHFLGKLQLWQEGRERLVFPKDYLEISYSIAQSWALNFIHNESVDEDDVPFLKETLYIKDSDLFFIPNEIDIFHPKTRPMEIHDLTLFGISDDDAAISVGLNLGSGYWRIATQGKLKQQLMKCYDNST